MIEATVEQYLVKRVLELKGEIRKVKWIGRRNAPDRFVCIPGRPAFLVECKAPGHKPRIGQQREIDRLRMLGMRVEVVDNMHAIDQILAP